MQIRGARRPFEEVEHDAARKGNPQLVRRRQPGTLTNLARLLNHGRLGGTGKLVILPVDQGFEHGPARSFAPNPPAYDPRYHFELAIEAGCNAYAAPAWLPRSRRARVRGRPAA